MRSDFWQAEDNSNVTTFARAAAGVRPFGILPVLMGFAAPPDHCSLFITSPSVMTLFWKQLRRYDTSKGTFRFPVDKPLPATLVKKLVRARLAENERKKKR